MHLIEHDGYNSDAWQLDGACDAVVASDAGLVDFGSDWLTCVGGFGQQEVWLCGDFAAVVVGRRCVVELEV